MGADKNKAMAVLHKIGMAILLGIISWLSLSVVSCRDRVLKLETQLEERGPRVERNEIELEQLGKTQQEILRTLVEQKDTDRYLSKRLELLEREHRP